MQQVIEFMLMAGEASARFALEHDIHTYTYTYIYMYMYIYIYIHTYIHQVMEFMLMAGEASARFALENDIPFLFSSQSPPEPPVCTHDVYVCMFVYVYIHVK